MELHFGEKWHSLWKVPEIFKKFTENAGKFEVAHVVFSKIFLHM